MSSRRNRDRSKSALPKLEDLPRLPYEEVASATFGAPGGEPVNQRFGDIEATNLAEVEIALSGDGAIRAYEYRLTGLGIDPAGLSRNKRNWELLGQLLFRLDHSIQWLIGDWLLQGETNRWGKHEEIARALNYEVKTLYDYRYVARHVHFSVRTDKLSFGHHKLLAHLEAAEQARWLRKAADGDIDRETGVSRPWSISRLRRELSDFPALQENQESPFERNLRRIDRELTRKKWNKLTVAERRKRYQHLRDILARMQRWGFD
ncbi:MAG: hypothetical protein OXE52_06215 [Chloroflexi bacterium]|nr:hypothetical protein [Chloroflexota bacterium]